LTAEGRRQIDTMAILCSTYAPTSGRITFEETPVTIREPLDANPNKLLSESCGRGVSVWVIERGGAALDESSPASSVNGAY
jgi:hypothetical protein